MNTDAKVRKRRFEGERIEIHASLPVANASPLALGWVGASCEFAALVLMLAMSWRALRPRSCARGPYELVAFVNDRFL